MAADGFSDDIDALFDATPPGISVRVARALGAVASQSRELFGAGLESVTGRPVQVTDVAIRAATYAEIEEQFAQVPHMGFEVRVAFSSSESHLIGALVALPDLGALLGIETGETAMAEADFARAQTAAAATSVRELLDFVSITLFSGPLHGVEASLSDLRIGQVEYTMGIVSDVARNAASVRVDLALSAPDGTTGTVTLVIPEPFLDRLADATAPEDEIEPMEPTPLRRSTPGANGRGASSGQSAGDDVDVHPVRFPPLPEVRGVPMVNVPRSLDLIMDVSMRVTVELGRSSMTVEEVLSLGPGSVVELNKLAGEPVDVLVNEQLIARGEVVVVDENFGVRVTEIVSPRRRAHAIGGM
jgi:flagellar motor switch protein FliN/FliY